MRTPVERVRALNQAAERPRRDYVLYWMVAARRTRFNAGLDVAVDAARRLGRPLLVLEGLRAGYPWASDRLHHFVLQGMADNARAFASRGITYFPYVEPEAGAGQGLIVALAAKACLIVTDDFPTFFVPKMQAAAARAVDVRMVTVDGNGLLPMRAAPIAFPTAYAFRRFLQRTIRPHLVAPPRPDGIAASLVGALAGAELPGAVARRYPAASAALLAGSVEALAALPIDHAVPPSHLRGGLRAARSLLAAFVAGGLDRYAEDRQHPDRDGASGLSPYLHFGHIGVHEILHELAIRESWDPSRLGDGAAGKREGFWGMSPAAEAFLDELITWRELGFATAAADPDHDRFESLPAWAQRTLTEHADDTRPTVYSAAALEAAATHDSLWNAAQRQLSGEGRLHNYLRMLWGKKILEWSPSPRAALATMIELNNRWALDGRDPNSYTGILWVLGKYDRPWAPVRPIFGTVRYMSSDNTRRKLEVKAYEAKWAGPGAPPRGPGAPEPGGARLRQLKLV
jgi:deoxyribodipyrimidine photo-lyase